MVAHKRRLFVTFSCGCSQAAAQYRCGTIDLCASFKRIHWGGFLGMIINRSLKALALGVGFVAIAGCETAPPPPQVVPASFTPLGVTAPYLMGDVVGGHKARAAKMHAARIKPLSPMEVGPYMSDLDAELRRQTAGIGLHVLQVGGSIIIRIPAIFTF